MQLCVAEMAECSSHFCREQELRGINMSGTFEMPEWKAKAEGKGLSSGQTSSKTIKEQRENLPIARLKPQVCGSLSKFLDNKPA